MRNDLIAVAAMAKNRVIGKDNKLPWHISADLRHFKRLTEGHVVVMGKNTYDSIGAPLPKRHCVVLTHGKATGAISIPSIEDLDRLLTSPIFAVRKVFVIGGSKVWDQLIPFCSEFWLTQLSYNVEGDTLMPEFEDFFAGYTVEEASSGYEIRHYLRNAPKNFVRTRSVSEHL